MFRRQRKRTSGAKRTRLFSASGQVELGYNVSVRRWLSIATFSLILLALPVWAQRRGGGGGGHFASGGGGAHFASRGGFAGHSSGAFRGGSFGRGSGVRIRTGNRYYNRRGLYGRRGYPYWGYPYYGYGGYYPWDYYGWDDDSLAYNTDNEDQDSYAGAAYPAPYPEKNSGLQRDVQALSGKIDRLQADVEARNRPKTDLEPATALVFRDQHIEEVRNYAIAGETLWVLNDKAAKKIPLAQLDLPATVKVNDDRGVDFQLPR